MSRDDALLYATALGFGLVGLFLLVCWFSPWLVTA